MQESVDASLVLARKTFGVRPSPGYMPIIIRTFPSSSEGKKEDRKRYLEC